MRLGNESAGAPLFRGFMAEVRKVVGELALGRFVEFDDNSAGLACNGIKVRCFFQPIIFFTE